MADEEHTYAVPAELAVDREAGRREHGPDGGRDVSDVPTEGSRRDAAPHGGDPSAWLVGS